MFPRHVTLISCGKGAVTLNEGSPKRVGGDCDKVAWLWGGPTARRDDMQARPKEGGMGVPTVEGRTDETERRVCAASVRVLCRHLVTRSNRLGTAWASLYT